jgi:hypothetical protein
LSSRGRRRHEGIDTSFLQPAVDALTDADDAGIDVVNLSFLVEPWLYN